MRVMDSFRKDVRYAVRALLQRPGFTLAALLPLGPSVYSTSCNRPDIAPPQAGREPTARLRVGDRNAFDVPGISLRAGRLFEPGDRPGSAGVALINPGLAMILAAIGIHGVVAAIVARRSREIGVRMALGARIRQVIALVVWQGIGLALVGLSVGIGGAVLTGDVIARLLFNMEPHDPLMFAGVTTLLLVVVGLACVVPASRAGRIPPASALRAE